MHSIIVSPGIYAAIDFTRTLSCPVGTGLVIQRRTDRDGTTNNCRRPFPLITQIIFYPYYNIISASEKTFTITQIPELIMQSFGLCLPLYNGHCMQIVTLAPKFEVLSISHFVSHYILHVV